MGLFPFVGYIFYWLKDHIMTIDKVATLDYWQYIAKRWAIKKMGSCLHLPFLMFDFVAFIQINMIETDFIKLTDMILSCYFNVCVYVWIICNIFIWYYHILS